MREGAMGLGEPQEHGPESWPTRVKNSPGEA